MARQVSGAKQLEAAMEQLKNTRTTTELRATQATVIYVTVPRPVGAGSQVGQATGDIHLYQMLARHSWRKLTRIKVILKPMLVHSY